MQYDCMIKRIDITLHDHTSTCIKDNFTFSSSGALLLSADTFGQDFHIFRVLPHPMCPSLGSVHHLYILHRGETMATVINDSVEINFQGRL